MSATIVSPREPTYLEFICDWCGRRDRHEAGMADIEGWTWFNGRRVHGVDGLRVNGLMMMPPPSHEWFCSAFCALSRMAFMNR